MLPPEWKKEIQDGVDAAAQRTQEYWERRQDHDSTSVAGQINALRGQLDTYTEQQTKAEGGKKRREILTIIGLFITAAIALGQGWFLYKQ